MENSKRVTISVPMPLLLRAKNICRMYGKHTLRKFFLSGLEGQVNQIEKEVGIKTIPTRYIKLKAGRPKGD